MQMRAWRFTPSSGTHFGTVVVLSLITAALAPLGFAAAADLTIVSSFPADKGPGYRKSAPDAAGAVGPKHTAVLDDRGGRRNQRLQGYHFRG